MVCKKISNMKVCKAKDMTLGWTFDFTSYVEIGRRGVSGPGTVHGDTFIFPLVRLLAVLNL